VAFSWRVAWLPGILLVGLQLVDVLTTWAVGLTAPAGFEANPLTRPWVEAGCYVGLLAVKLGAAALVALAYPVALRRYRDRPSPWRRMVVRWLVPGTVVVYGAAALNNLARLFASLSL